MHTTTLFLSAIAATALASPITPNLAVWTSAEGTTTKCDASSDKYLEVPASSSSSLAEGACKVMMPPCAFPPFGKMMCTAVMDWALDGPRSYTLKETVMSKGNDVCEKGGCAETRSIIDTPAVEASGWKANLTVTPAPQPENSAGVMWTAADCIGYFSQLLFEADPNGCAAAGMGAGAGKLTVGGDSTLKDTVFALSFVEGA